MSKEQLKAFREAAKADTALQEKLKAVQPTQQGADALVAIAKEAGFVISRDDLYTMGKNDRPIDGVVAKISEQDPSRPTTRGGKMSEENWWKEREEYHEVFEEGFFWWGD
jgi:predicted ribosomally synthesized peptide with nif11-like leader